MVLSSQAYNLFSFLFPGLADSSSDVRIVSPEARKEVVSMILLDIVEKGFLDLPQSSSNGSMKSIENSPRSTPDYENEAAVSASLAVELVGTCSTVMGSSFTP